MKFKLFTAGDFYPKEEDRQRLQNLGFSFKDTGSHFGPLIEGNPEIEINTLDELMQFIELHGDIILDKAGHIQIYDDYVE
jgi:hypothetical protein